MPGHARRARLGSAIKLARHQVIHAAKAIIRFPSYQQAGLRAGLVARGANERNCARQSAISQQPSGGGRRRKRARWPARLARLRRAKQTQRGDKAARRNESSPAPRKLSPLSGCNGAAATGRPNPGALSRSMLIGPTGRISFTSGRPDQLGAPKRTRRQAGI